MFKKLKHTINVWGRHKHAPAALGVLSFAEASFFPIPPDVMLAPMAVAKPKRASWLAALTTITSVLGGLLGYAIGFFALAWIAPKLQAWGYWPAFEHAQEMFNEWGFVAVFIAGFTPIPFKIFTIAAGAAQLNLVVFTLAALIGRGMRFFIVALAAAHAGGPMLEWAAKHKVLGYILTTVGVIALGVLWKLRH